jgi:putative transposase
LSIYYRMPTRNAVKEYASDSYYHIYTRGVNKRKIFMDDADYAFFLSLLKRYLSVRPVRRPKHPPYRTFSKEITLLSFCLMPNHVHFFVRQYNNADAIRDFMRAVMTSYSRYFNDKYSRLGPLFQSRYLASRVAHDSYLMHISRYIHLNPRQWQSYPYSSIKYFQGQAFAEWFSPAPTLELFGNSIQQYLLFLHDYKDYKNSLEMIDCALAHT